MGENHDVLFVLVRWHFCSRCFGLIVWLGQGDIVVSQVEEDRTTAEDGKLFVQQEAGPCRTLPYQLASLKQLTVRVSFSIESHSAMAEISLRSVLSPIIRHTDVNHHHSTSLQLPRTTPAPWHGACDRHNGTWLRGADSEPHR